VRKEYLALVRGVVADDAGTIDAPIGPAPGSPVYNKLAVGTGRASRTDWRVERRLAGRTLLRLAPRTGRRHQLRVHLAALGHPILGDLLYGEGDRAYLDLVAGRGDVRAAAGPRRQLLHCARLAFPDPAGPGECEVAAPLPSDFTAHLA